MGSHYWSDQLDQARSSDREPVWQVAGVVGFDRASCTKIFDCQKNRVKKKDWYSSSWESHLRATGRHLSYGITQCYLPPDTSEVSEHAPPNPSHAGWYSIYLPRRDGRLRWPSWLDSAPAESRTSDLSITSPTPNRCITKTSSDRVGKSSRSVREAIGLVEVKLIGIKEICCRSVPDQLELYSTNRYSTIH